LARNLWWTWNQEAQEVFHLLSPRCWQNLYHNAVAVLHEVSDYELRVRLQDCDFARQVRAVLDSFNAYLKESKTWAASTRRNCSRTRPPIFPPSSAFTRHCQFPPAASASWPATTPNRPATSAWVFVGVSLFYREGYFQQAINQDNWQSEYYTRLNPKNLPIEPVLNSKGEPLVCTVEIAMNEVYFQTWRANVGRCPVYLLDTNRPENEQHYRDLTLRVYGGDSTTRIMQEVLLGVGGVRLLRALGVQPSGVSHERRPRGLFDAGTGP